MRGDQAERSIDERGSSATPTSGEMGFFFTALRHLRRNTLLICAIVFVLPLAVVLFAESLPNKYSASSSIMIETNVANPVGLKEILSDTPADAEAIATELERITSRELLEQVCDTLDLVHNPEFVAPSHPNPVKLWVQGLVGWVSGELPGLKHAGAAARPRPLTDAVEALRRGLVVGPVGRARVIRITFTSQNPDTAALVVNTLAKVYIDEQKHLRDDATREANRWIGARLASLKSRADAAAAAVQDYKAKNGLIRGRDSLLVQQNLSEVSTQLNAARAKHAQTQAVLADAQRALSSGRPDRVGTVLNSTLIQRLREQEATLAGQSANLAVDHWAGYPPLVALNAELRNVRSQIAAETDRILQSLRSDDAIAAANVKTLEAQMGSSRSQVDQANAQDVGLQQLQREAEIDEDLFRAFLTRSKETDPVFDPPRVNVELLSLAISPDRPISPNRKLIAVAGVVLSVLVAIGAVFIKVVCARGVRSHEDFERLIGWPLLGIFPMMRSARSDTEPAHLLNAVTALWMRLLAPNLITRPKSIVITSAVPREGKTAFARMFAMVAAERGQRVLLVDADLRCSSLTQTLTGCKTRKGLAEVIRGEFPLREVVYEHLPKLDVLPAGEFYRDPTDLLSRPGFSRFLDVAENDYDLVLIDSPPVLIGPDASLLANGVQSTVMLARWGHTSASAIVAALQSLRDHRVRCAGVVMSLVDLRQYAMYDQSAALAISRSARRYYLKPEAAN